MAHGTARAAATACLGLLALQAAGGRGGAGTVASLLNDVNTFVARALDPAIPAIPDLRNGEHWGAGARAVVPNPGTWIDPVITGQASPDGSSGHNYNG